MVKIDSGDTEINYMLNLLWENSAQAISINSIRISNKANIKKGLDIKSVIIDDKKFDTKVITFRAIGDKIRFAAAVDFSFSDNDKFGYYDTKIEISDSVTIPKQ